MCLVLIFEVKCCGFESEKSVFSTMAAAFTRRIISSATVSQKFRFYLSAKELSCSSSLNFYCLPHSNIICAKTSLILKNKRFEPLYIGIRRFSENSQKPVPPPCEQKNEETKKLSLFQRFKEMYKKYWYVMVPVHLVTSAAWFGGFYYLAKRYIIRKFPLIYISGYL